MVGRLSDQVAVVTGGAEGLGNAIARRLVDEGATVVITDVQGERGAAAASALQCTFIVQDVCDEAQWPQVVEEVEGRFGALHILVNNAGILGPMDAVNPEDTSLPAWRRIFAVNVEGVFLGCRAALPAMRRAGRGAIVNLSSMADRVATPQATAYGASKAAVRQLTMSVAQHCTERRLAIRCNSVHPGMVRTPLLNKAMLETAQARGVPYEQIIREYQSVIPLGDFTRAEDVAAAVAFLASDDARHVTGSAILVDGGLIHCRSSRQADAE
jgi:3(or 17)beta-hydroxysteroid dehydrogenase